MRIISIRQPWCSAIIERHKNIEFRSWATKYRGPLAIHASKTFDPVGLQHLLECGVPIDPDPKSYPIGAILGRSELVDCLCIDRVTPEIYRMGGCYPGLFGFKLSGVVPFAAPIICRGRLGIWKPNEELARLIESAIEIS